MSLPAIATASAEMTAAARDRLAEIQARLQAATPGPWVWDFRPDVRMLHLISLMPWRPVVMAFHRWGMNGATAWFRTAGHPAASRLKAPHEGGCPWPHPDAELIAHARADFDWAVGEIERLRAALHAIAGTTEAIRYEAGENGPIRVAAWLVEPRHMDAARAALEPIAPVGAGTETEGDRA